MNQERLNRLRARRHRPFTLIEILAAMAIFVVLMAVMFQFIAGAEKIWTRADRNAKIYGNARTAIDIISRDLQSAIASDMPGREIPFYYNDAEEVPAFVTATNLLPADGGYGNLAEVTYEVDGNQLRRYIVSTGTAWDFYDINTDWYSNPGSWNASPVVVDGVRYCSIVAYDYTGNPPFPTPGEVQTSSYLALPQMAEIRIRVFDPGAPDAEQDKTARTFSKTVYFRTQQ